MKKYKYVVVSGCSFSASDYSDLVNPGETYGDLIADHYETEFYNLSESGGSLEYVNRVILEWCGKNIGELKDTLIILGMPAIDRYEVWSNKNESWLSIQLADVDRVNGWVYLKDKELLIKEWNCAFYSYNLKHIRNYIKNCWNENDTFRKAINIIVGLQSFFKLNNIDHVFFDASALPSYDKYWKSCDEKSFGEQYSNRLLWDSLIETKNWYKHPKYKSMMDFTEKNRDMRISDIDIHPNKEGHKYWSECLIEYINEKI